MPTVQSTNPYDVLGLGDKKSSEKSTAQEATDSFMQLLTAQLKNQDPLNPMDNAQFTSQLAQLNTLEGILNLNKTLDGFAEQFGASQMLNAVGMLDRHVLVQGSSFNFDGTNGVSAAFDVAASGADAAKVSVYNEAGEVVDEIELTNPQGRNFFEWDGLNADGEAFPAGKYRFEVTASKEGKTVATRMLTYQKVESIEKANDGTIYAIVNGSPIKVSDIREII